VYIRREQRNCRPASQNVTRRICVANFYFTATYSICVSVEMNLTNRVGEILGFGETTEGNTKMPCTLQRAYIQIFTIKQCNESELPSHTSNPRVLCAGVIGGGVDSCQVGKTTQVMTWCSYSCSKYIYIYIL
jgi:hypothetical protein